MKRVAESTVTLGPIRQRGWRRAISGVTWARSSGSLRKGPPLAVRMSSATSSRLSPRRAWKRAECSESTGRISAPWASASRHKRGPAATMASLLARATRFPVRTAARVGASPARPGMAATATSASRAATSSAVASLSPGKRALSSLWRLSSAATRRGFQRAICRERARGFSRRRGPPPRNPSGGRPRGPAGRWNPWIRGRRPASCEEHHQEVREGEGEEEAVYPVQKASVPGEEVP